MATLSRTLKTLTRRVPMATAPTVRIRVRSTAAASLHEDVAMPVGMPDAALSKFDSMPSVVDSEQLLAKPFVGPSVWTGDQLAASPWWGHMLSEADINDLISATTEAMKTVQWRAEGVPEVIAKEDFPLGAEMKAKLQDLADELEYGKGLAMIRNMPVPALDDRVTEKDLAVMYLGVSAHIGNVVMQSSSGLRSVSRGYGMPLGRVQAEMTGETPKGGKQTNNHFRLHTDRCDVISLMSLRTAPTGGASRVCSAPAVFNAILERTPELAKALTEPIDRIWEGEKGYFSLPVVGATPTGQFTTQISPSYVENAQFLEHAKKATADQVAALDAIETVGMELGAEFIMAPGMLYFLNNHQVYHGRGNWSVTDNEAKGEWGNEGRLLFRTWISPYNSRCAPLPSPAPSGFTKYPPLNDPMPRPPPQPTAGHSRVPQRVGLRRGRQAPWRLGPGRQDRRFAQAQHPRRPRLLLALRRRRAKEVDGGPLQHRARVLGVPRRLHVLPQAMYSACTLSARLHVRSQAMYSACTISAFALVTGRE